MKEYQGFVESLLCTEGMAGGPEGGDWLQAMVDAMIVYTLRESAKSKLSTEESIQATLSLFEERLAEWVPTFGVPQ